jgi:GNAT superfamily N-acetyltransferase
MKIRRAVDADTAAVHALYAACHPTWPAKPVDFWWAHPTLVLEVDGAVCGATAFAVTVAPAPDLATLARADQYEVGWGHGVYVDPGARGHGYGWALAEARHEALKALGVPLFFGMTQPGNRAMRAIFERQGLKHTHTIPNAYPDGSKGMFYAGEVA